MYSLLNHVAGHSFGTDRLRPLTGHFWQRYHTLLPSAQRGHIELPQNSGGRERPSFERSDDIFGGVAIFTSSYLPVPLFLVWLIKNQSLGCQVHSAQ